MAKAAKQMGMEKLCWEIVRMEQSLQVCERFKAGILQTVQQTPPECPEVSAAIMQTILKLEADYRERMARLELEHARREREYGVCKIKCVNSQTCYNRNNRKVGSTHGIVVEGATSSVHQGE
jgi:hypothetical protein